MTIKDLVSGVLAIPITTSTTNILVSIAQGIGAQGIRDFFPTPPFYITIMPKSPAIGVANRLNSEIIKVTAVGNDQTGNAALTGVRAQRDTTAKEFAAGDIVTVSFYSDDAVLLGETSTSLQLLKDKNGNTITPAVDVLNYLYPVGSIYMSATMSTVAQVQTAFGGTWVKWGAGRVPVGVDTSQTEFNTTEKTGGEKTHTLTTNEMPRHRHYNGVRWNTDAGAYYLYGSNGQGIGSAYDNDSGFAGGDGAHNNLQPFITCYMYKRTA